MLEDAIVDIFVADGRVSGAVLGGALGAVAGLIGYIIGRIFFKDTKYVSIVICIVIALSLPLNRLAKEHLEEIYADRYLEKSVGRVISGLERERLFAVIFKYHPEARGEIERRIKHIIATAPDGEVEKLSFIATNSVVDGFFQRHLPAASDEAIRDLLEHELSVLKRFAHMPELCVAYALGSPDLLLGKVPYEIIKETSDIKASIIESAVQGCRVYIEWNEALVGLEVKKWRSYLRTFYI